jgi:hypothetical protein
MNQMQRDDKLPGAVFLIGIGLLFLFNFWWPGILFVLGATSAAHGAVRGQREAIGGGIGFVAIGFLFWTGFNLVPFLLIAAGLSILFGSRWYKPQFWQNLWNSAMTAASEPTQSAIPEKRKNDQVASMDDDYLGEVPEKRKRGSALVLGDDGEVIGYQSDDPASRSQSGRQV